MMNASSLENASPNTIRSGTQVEAYRAPHKGLRFMLSNLLVKMGQAELEERADAASILADLATVIWVCDGHIHHEDTFLRPALVERARSAVATLDQEHEEHTRHVQEMKALGVALAEAETARDRARIGKTLYLHFSVFVAETLAHMAYEERVVQPLLDRLFTPQELLEIHMKIIRSIAPQDMLVYLRGMIPGANRGERAELLAGPRSEAPPVVFDAIMSEVRLLLSTDDFDDLCDRLDYVL